MSFTTKAGSRGGKRLAGPVFRLVNKIVGWQVRRSGGRAMGGDMLVLTTVGRKSGAARSVPVAWFPDEDGNYLVVASANGAKSNPNWYYNIAANPDKIVIEVRGNEKVEVTATQLHGEERARAWERIVAASDRFGGYQKKTDREIPVIRLVPRA